MQVIEVGMGDQDQIDWGKIADVDSRLPQALQNEQPAGKIGINDHILSPNLQEKAGMPNKGNPHLPTGYQHRFVRFPGSRRDRRVANQSSKLPGASAQGGISKSLF